MSGGEPEAVTKEPDSFELPEWNHGGFCVLRSPLFPWGSFLEWTEKATCPGQAQESDLARALSRDRASLRSHLEQVVERPEVRDALYMASPSLFHGLDDWREAPDTPDGRRAERSLVRYFARMSGRSTPFGLFSGNCVVQIGDETDLGLPEPDGCRRKTLLRPEILLLLMERLLEQRDVRRRLRYRRNGTAYSAGSKLRYVERTVGEEGEVTYTLNAADATPVLAAALECAGQPTPFEKIATAVARSSSAADADAARSYVDELVDAQLLVPVLVPLSSEQNPAKAFVANLREIPAARPVRTAVEEALRELESIDRQGVGVALGRYAVVREELEEHLGDQSPSMPLLADLIKPAGGASLAEDVVTEVLDSVLAAAPAMAHYRIEALEDFKEAFLDRYGKETRVPLLQALDDAVGVGFGQEPAGGSRGERGSPVSSAGSDDGLSGRLLRRLYDSWTNGTREIELDRSDIDVADSLRLRPLPDSFAVVGTLVAQGAEAVDRGDFRFVFRGASGPSGARVLGRWCSSHDTLRSEVRSYLRREEGCRRNDAVYAEIVHHPEGRTGAVACRPPLRDVDLSYRGGSQLDPDRVIPASDLMVSVQGDRIVLTSERLEREVIPRMSNAHNFTRSGVDVYRFLCQLQHQGVVPSLYWDWGELKAAPFLPRVTFGKLVLSPAQWRISGKLLSELEGRQGEEGYRRVSGWRRRHDVPRFVSLRDNEARLPLDLENILCVEALLDAARGREELRLVEFFGGDEGLCVESGEGKYVHEVVLPFLRSPQPDGGASESGREHRREKAEEEAAHTLGPALRTSRANIGRDLFPPLSEWLYAKLYLGGDMADEILVEELAPRIETLKSEKLIGRWFFVRYSDPDFHLRVRLNGEPDTLRDEVAPFLVDSLTSGMASGLVPRLEFGTYRRETARYGGPKGVRLAEDWFAADSDAVVALLDRNAFGGESGRRLQVGVCAADALLTGFGLPREARMALLEQRQNELAADLDIDGNLRHVLSDEYRRHRDIIDELVRRVRDGADRVPDGLVPVYQRSARTESLVREIVRGVERGRVERSVQRFASIFLHMHVNRLFDRDHRRMECVLCHFLWRQYESEAAREGDR